MENTNQNQFDYFQVFTGSFDPDGGVKREKSVGYASMRQGHNMYSLKFWTFPNEKYYLLPSRHNPMKLSIMTRQEKSPHSITKTRGKYDWRIVGNADVCEEKGFAILEFDLLSKPIFMSMKQDHE